MFEFDSIESVKNYSSWLKNLDEFVSAGLSLKETYLHAQGAVTKAEKQSRIYYCILNFRLQFRNSKVDCTLSRSPAICFL